MKKKMKNFFTLTRKANGGFTLVELIVVIAILAILGGVAVPTYSGYIEKTKYAADETLLNAVNKAFASACVTEGNDIYNVQGAELEWEGKAVTGVSSVKDVTDVTGYDEAFAMFYSGNEDVEFQVYKTLMFDVDKHMFVDPANVENFTFMYGGNKITVSGEAIKALQESTFGSVMGGEALLNEIVGLTNMMGSGATKLADDLLADTEAGGYMQKYAAYLGVENASSLTGDALIAAVEAKLGEAYIKNGIDPDDVTDEMINSSLVNGMVFYAAEGMKDYTVDSATELLNSDNIYSSLSSDPATRLAQASLVYGMYAGFVNSDYNTGDAANGVAKAKSSTDNPMAAIQNISGSGVHSDNFQKYLDSDQGKADIKAYMDAMGVINDASGNGAGAGVLVNGFADSELESTLTQVLGK